MLTRRTFGLVAIISIACLFVSISIAQEADPQSAIDGLLVEKRDVLAQRVDLLETMYAEGRSPIDLILRARLDLLDAEIQLVQAKKDRVELYRRRLENLKELERTVNERVETGISTPDLAFAATAARIQAEIDMLRAGQ